MITVTNAPVRETLPAAYDVEKDPINDVLLWELSERERVIYELGFHMGYSARQGEIDQLDHEADRLYVAAFNHRDCTCWRRQGHIVRWA